MNRTEPVSSGIRLQRLIQNCHTEILGREKNNDKFIHLYNIGTHWVAFEQSACGLSRIFPQCEIALFMVAGRPDYVVMASIPVDEANVHFHKHIFCNNELDYKMLTASPLSEKCYYRWHINAVKSVL